MEYVFSLCLQMWCVCKRMRPLPQQGTPGSGTGGQPREHSSKGGCRDECQQQQIPLSLSNSAARGQSAASQDTGEHHDELKPAPAQARAKTSKGPGEHGTYAPPSHNARRHPVIKESLAQFGSLPTALHCQVPRPAQHQDHTSIRPCTS